MPRSASFHSMSPTVPLRDLRLPSRVPPTPSNHQTQTPADITRRTSSPVSSQSLRGLNHPFSLGVYQPLVLKTRLHYQGYPLLPPTSTAPPPVSVPGASGSRASILTAQAPGTYQVSASHDGGDVSSVRGPERFSGDGEETVSGLSSETASQDLIPKGTSCPLPRPLEIALPGVASYTCGGGLER